MLEEILRLRDLPDFEPQNSLISSKVNGRAGLEEELKFRFGNFSHIEINLIMSSSSISGSAHTSMRAALMFFQIFNGIKLNIRASKPCVSDFKTILE